VVREPAFSVVSAPVLEELRARLRDGTGRVVGVLGTNHHMFSRPWLCRDNGDPAGLVGRMSFAAHAR